MSKTVLVSGGSGYIAGFIIRQLLEEGWRVNTTVRSLSREAELRPLLGGNAETLRFFAADLTADAGWADAMAGCTHVLHVASPFSSKPPRNPDDLIIPAREGTVRTLRLAQEAGVRRFVQTSSVAAIAYGHGKGHHHFTEADWTNIHSRDAYAYVKSKTIAERAARDWMAKAGTGMEFLSINPSAVLGPVWSKDFSASIELVSQLLSGALPGCPDLGFGIVDVRDLADLHVRVLTEPGLDGERFIASGPFLKMAEVAAILRQHMPLEARNVTTRRLPNWVVRAAATFNPLIRQVVGELGNVREASSAHAFERLGWKTRPNAESIVDCAKSLIAQGVVRV
jgi:dihydroflavonol-4-reductase